jgi:DNA repair protein RecO (recombination protein O)
MTENATGLVLRTRPLTETSLIIHWLTPDLGRVATVAKGARRPKSPFQGKLDLFYLADFSFSRSRTSELHTLREINVRETHAFLRQEIAYVQQAAYCIGLIEQATETETPLGPVFELFRTFLLALPAHPPQSQLIFGFEVKLLTDLGLKPDLSETKLTAGSKALVTRLELADWSGISRLRLNPVQETEVSGFLQGFLVFHLGRIPKGRESALGRQISPIRR